MTEIGDLKEFRNNLKRIFAGYTAWTPHIYNELSRLGFDIDDHGSKHAILRINVKGHKYLFSISKTPSDKRAGLNNVSIIYSALLRNSNSNI